MQKTIFLSLPNPNELKDDLSKIDGISDLEIGYINGQTAYPKKADVDSGTSGHAYALKVSFDNSLIPQSVILARFINKIDPYLPKGEKKMPTRAGFYYTNLLDGMDADSFFSSTLRSGWNIEITKMMNFFLAK